MEDSEYQKKTEKTLSKKKPLKNGLSVKELITQLNSNISITKGMLAILSSKHQSRWMHQWDKTPREHLEILLQEAMDEIWKAESNLLKLEKILEKKY